MACCGSARWTEAVRCVEVVLLFGGIRIECNAMVSTAAPHIDDHSPLKVVWPPTYPCHVSRSE